MRVTASALERLWNCPTSAALPQAPHTGEAALAGVANHSKVELSAAEGDLTNAPDVVKQAFEGARQVKVEVAYAIDVHRESVRYIGERLSRDYGPLGDSEIALTLDALIWRPDGVWVWDWKSRKRVTPALRNLQLRAAAVAVLKSEGLSRVHGGIGYLDNSESDTHTFDAFDAATFFPDMRGMLNRIGAARALAAVGGKPEVHSGPWCEYCPAISHCPAHTRLAMTMIGELDYVEKELAEMTAEQVGKAWDLLRRIQTLAERVETSLKLRAKHDVIPLPNGKRLALVDTSRSAFDRKKAKKWIREQGGDPAKFEKRSYFSRVMEINMPAVEVAADYE